MIQEYQISTYLDTKERCKKDVGEDDEVDLVEKAAEHQDDQDQVHDGEHAQRHALVTQQTNEGKATSKPFLSENEFCKSSHIGEQIFALLFAN